MKTRMAFGLCLAWIVVVTAQMAWADPPDYRENVTFKQRSLSGPRFGVAIIPGDNQLYQNMRDEDVGRVVSLFGWHFEHRLVPEEGGPQFLVETVPMIAGVEYGKFIPVMTLAMGVRFPSGYEFGLGPSVMAMKENGDPGIETSLVVAVGKSFDYGGVSIPLNFTYSTSPDGDRFGIVIGYAINR